MVITITYPANSSEWYAKGTALGDIYFEVPAIFNADGSCDVAATNAKVDKYLNILAEGAK